jgi:FkbM family methyltransferase
MEVVNSRYGKLIASRQDMYVGRSLFEYGEFSEGEVELFRQIVGPEAIVCDVGANIGAHTLALAKMAKHVHAFEPQPMLFNALCGMAALNYLRNVTCYQVGIGETEGVMSYCDLNFEVPNNLGSAPLDKFTGDFGVKVFPLTTPCHFLKVDVEGMELEVLKGARDMIREYKPALYIENDRPEKSDELIDYIRSLGYFPHWHCPALFNPNNFKGNKTELYPGVGSINMLCAPFRIESMEEAKDWHFVHSPPFDPKNFEATA